MKLTSLSVLRLFAGASLLLGVLAAQAEDKKADPSGTWVWTQQRGGQGGGGGGEPREVTLKIKSEGEKYLGTLINPPRGDSTTTTETKIDNIKVKGEEIAFSVTREFNGNSFTAKYSGKISGDTITGKVETERNGEARSRDWVAKRKKDTK